MRTWYCATVFHTFNTVLSFRYDNGGVSEKKGAIQCSKCFRENSRCHFPCKTRFFFFVQIPSTQPTDSSLILCHSKKKKRNGILATNLSNSSSTRGNKWKNTLEKISRTQTSAKQRAVQDTEAEKNEDKRRQALFPNWKIARAAAKRVRESGRLGSGRCQGQIQLLTPENTGTVITETSSLSFLTPKGPFLSRHPSSPTSTAFGTLLPTLHFPPALRSFRFTRAPFSLGLLLLRGREKKGDQGNWSVASGSHSRN